MQENEEIPASIVFRPDPETWRTWERVKATRGGTGNQAFMDVVHRVDASIRGRLDESALALYEAGKLTRTEYERACVRFQRAKSAARFSAES